ncbi:hypothetical protein ABET51_02775 [Metabacillus fastidiosus]|uniref:hypothetical protein n=1 Tax=Metabacillus fastidiosus TaxID=1458 RepID=UPI003D2D3E97
MKKHKVKIHGEPEMTIEGEIYLFDDGMGFLLRKDNDHYLNAKEVVYILEKK